MFSSCTKRCDEQYVEFGGPNYYGNISINGQPVDMFTLYSVFHGDVLEYKDAENDCEITVNGIAICEYHGNNPGYLQYIVQ
jgi:hypothetical protein